jgi:hypothetical protein
LYEKAIEGYKFNVERYKDWMNLYAIFVGAFFVAYYTIFASGKNDILLFIIALLGLIASYMLVRFILWLLSLAIAG